MLWLTWPYLNGGVSLRTRINMGYESIIQMAYEPHECMSCNETVFKWFDIPNLEEFWGTEMGRATCGRSGNLHQVNEFAGDT